jgi:hypothetical protein
MYEARRPGCAHGLHGGNYFSLLPRSALDGRAVLHFNSSAVETDVILRGNFSNIFQYNLQQNFFALCIWKFPTKTFPRKFTPKKSAEFSGNIFGHPTNFFWATVARPTWTPQARPLAPQAKPQPRPPWGYRPA